MTQHPHDQMSKQYLQDFLEPIGIITRNMEVTIEIDGFFDADEQEDFMALSQAFLDWEQQTKAEDQFQGVIQGEQTIVLRLLNRKFGDLPDSIYEQLMALDSELLGGLTEALLDFSSIDDLTAWLEANHFE
jgi:Domain of unknown function (DUF4351)